MTATAVAEPSPATPVATAPPEQPASEATPVAADVEEGVEDAGSEGEVLPPPVPTPVASTVRELLALGRPLVIGHAGG